MIGSPGTLDPPVLSRMRHEIVDPAEDWETPVPSSVAGRLDPEGRGPRLVQATSEADLPPGVLRLLRYACGPLPLERTFLLAASARPVDRSCRRFVSTPVQVLGFGERATGLWVDRGRRDPAAIVPVARIGAIEDLAVLRCRRLSVRAADVRLSVRYSSETGSLLLGALRWLRRRAAGDAQGPVPPVGQCAVGADRIPGPWQQLIETLARDAPPGGIATLFGRAPDVVGDGVARGALVGLTSTELLVLVGPDATEAAEVAGPDVLAMVDRLAVPRHALQTVTAAGERLVIRAAGVERQVAIGATLARAAAELLETAGPARRPLSVAR